MTTVQARDLLAQWRASSLTPTNGSLSGPELAVRAAELFKVLSDATRLRIIQLLIANNEMTVNGLADGVEMSQSSVSHHLRVLRHFHLVRTRRAGKEVHYAADDSHVELLLRVCAEHLASDN